MGQSRMIPENGRLIDIAFLRKLKPLPNNEEKPIRSMGRSGEDFRAGGIQIWSLAPQL